MHRAENDPRALFLVVILVAASAVATLAALSTERTTQAAVATSSWMETLSTPPAVALDPGGGDWAGATPTPLPTMAVVASPTAAHTSTVTAVPSITVAEAAGSPTTATTPSSTATKPVTASATHATTTTPVATATATLTPVPPTATSLPSPTATPTPRPMALRGDLPAMQLQDWPRPAGDNGWGMHFVVNSYPSDEEIYINVQRLVDMRIKWAVVIYGDELILQRLAPAFRDAGIMVVWRPMIRPYERYYEWERDIQLLREMGVQPYMQIYNEPSVSQEWPDGISNQALFHENLIAAIEAVYNADGYVGLQFNSEIWLVDALNTIKARGGEVAFGRMFFIPHSYGMNHPPDYTEDINAVLNFRNYAHIFQEQIGFVPPMIVGEGGWKWGATDDARFPKVSDELHRDYYVALYDWFRTGILPNGEPLPNYLFAFCPWLIAHKMDDNAFYDSFAGDRVMTIEAIKAIPNFTRRFSWN